MKLALTARSGRADGFYLYVPYEVGGISMADVADVLDPPGAHPRVGR
jgi:hypothetical protein